MAKNKKSVLKLPKNKNKSVFKAVMTEGKEAAHELIQCINDLTKKKSIA